MSDWKTLKLHEVASLFPAMTDEELDSLGKDIREYGLKHPIVLDERGKHILDGRCRWIAMMNVGYRPRPGDFVCWDGEGSMIGFVCSLNLERRMLTTSQRAAIAVKLKPAIEREIAEWKAKKCSEAGKKGGRGKKGSAESGGTLSEDKPPVEATIKAAKVMNVGKESVRQAEKVADISPETFQEIKEGKKTIHAAVKELGLAPGKHKVKVAGKPMIDVNIPDPAKVVDPEVIAEEYAERRAIQDDISDELWVESLPLYSQLEGQKQKDFRYWAVKARQFQPIRKAFAKELGGILPRNRKTPSYFYAFVRALEQRPPEEWTLCSEKDGGCGGTGVQIGLSESDRLKCPGCHGDGYLIR